MRLLLKTVLLISMCSLSFGIHAETSKIVTFENQREENFTLESFLKETLYKTETIDSTCYREQSSQENVCRDVTRYRQECSNIPEHQECNDTYERECRDETTYENVCRYESGEEECSMVTRYREECNGGAPGGRECRTIPGDVECHIYRGENHCEKIPPREECTETPGTPRTCHQVAYQERECHDGPSRQVCHSEPTTRQECTNVPRQNCEWIPTHRVCESVPYEENVCGLETVTRKIPYACKEDVQVPYEKVVKTNTANVQVNFEAATFSPKMNFTFNLDKKGVLDLAADSISSPKHFALLKKNIKNQDAGEVNTINAEYNINFINLENELTATNNGISNVNLKSDSISFIVNGKFDPKKAIINFNIAKKGETKFNGSAKSSQFKTTFDGHQTNVTIDLKSLGAPKLGGIFNRNHHVNISIVIDYSSLGEIIAPKDSKFTIANAFDVKVD